MKRTTSILTVTAVAALAFTAPAAAQDWPTRPIRVITTTSAGGISDIFMRSLGEELRQKLGQPLVIENRPGGMQNLGVKVCQDSAPDGYTICIANADPMVYNQFLLKNMPFDPINGVQPITGLFHLIHLLVVNSDLKVKTIDELIALSKQKAGTLSYSTPGVPMQLYMETLVKEKGADWVRVPFKGGGDLVNAVISGSTPIALFGEGNVIGQIQAGKMTPLVMMNNIRSPNFPQVPLLEETGYKGAPSRSWYGLFAPNGTPRAIIDRINREVGAVLENPDFRQKNLTARSLVPLHNSPEDFGKLIAGDRVVAQQVVKDAGLEPQ
jgi:tripartite-type tricarboxylate transporter receptor subunit TctC